MRSKTANFVYAARLLFCLGVALTPVIAALAGCGSTGGSIQTPTTPIITWANPAAITYGTALSGTQLNATANVPGTFVYTPASGTVPKAGTQTLSATFTPTDTTDYTTAAASAQIVVNQATPTVSVWPTAGAITSGQTLASSTLTGGTASVPGGFAWTTPTTIPPAGTDTENVTFTPTDTTDYTVVNGSAQIVVNPPTPTITSVSLLCTTTSITNVQTTSCTPTVTGTGSFTNTVNLTLAPTSAGTLSASKNVASGTPVVFTPTFTAGVQTPTITATSTADPTKSSAPVKITVTLRTITISAPTGNIWLPDCSALIFYSVAQTGMVNGDTIHDDPYPPATYTVTPPSTLPISLGIGNDPGVAGACSPGAYDQYVTGTDGARSNDQYIPILSPWNMWAGYNSTDEFQADFAGKTTCPYKLTDGTPDGTCLPVVGLVTLVDGNNLIAGGLIGNGGMLVYNITTGALTSGVNNSGGTIVGAAAKNGIVGYTTTSPSLSFSMEQLNSPNLATLSNVGTAPMAVAMSTGCNTNPNAASAFTYDQAGSTLYRADAVGNVSNYTVTASRVNSVALSGFSPASGLPNNLARYVVAWDSTCKAAVLAPVLTGGNNPDGTPAYEMAFALVDMTSGNARQLGTYLATGIPSTAIRMAADPSGNDVVIASTNQAAGTTVLTKISWTLDVNENPTFSVTTLGSAPPTGVYGVSLGILPSSVVPNGNVLRVGQREQHYALPNQ
jgi:hypothetical protein